MIENKVPKVIWIFWSDGWKIAPAIVKKCLQTWHEHNPNWVIKELSKDNLSDYLNLDAIIPHVCEKKIQIEALSDVIRISLLQTYGGVWVDSTLYCNQPLDNWLSAFVDNTGFFAFSKPSIDRLLSSWFLASNLNNYIIKKWYERTVDYWASRPERDHYFWFHYLFGELYNQDDYFRSLWDKVPVISADAPHYFIPYETSFSNVLTKKVKMAIDYPVTPVFKLTHKYDRSLVTENSTLTYLLNRKAPTLIDSKTRLLDIFRLSYFKIKPRNRLKLFIAWYGIFDGHGTIGDLLSLQALTNYLYSKKIYEIDYASYERFKNLAGKRVNWKDVDPNKYDVFIFVCGPILKNHPYLPELFEKFKVNIKIGVGVSLFKEDHFNYLNPFDFVFAREGAAQKYSDVAIVAPKHSLSHAKRSKRDGELIIGVSLRGHQEEYGVENCLHELTETTVEKMTEALLQNRAGRVVYIENHLKRSGKRPNEIEDIYSKCDLIVTSRLHGALLALRHSVPYIAIDQIRNGAKLFNILKDYKWPFVYRVEDIIFDDLVLAGNEILSGKHQKKFIEVREEILADANHSLLMIHECIQKIEN